MNDAPLNTKEMVETSEEELGDIKVDWKEIPRLSEFKADYRECVPFHDDQAMKIQNWLDNLNIEGKAKITAAKNRSKVVPKLIRKQAEWRYAALTEPFLSSHKLFQAEARTWEDIKAAEQNTLVLNHQFSTKINKNFIVDHAVRTAVNEGTVIFRVGWEYKDETVTEVMPVVELTQNPEIGEILQQALELKTTNPNEYERMVPYELQQAVEDFEITGIPSEPTITGEEEVEVVKIIENRPTVEVCESSNFYIDPSCGGDISKASFAIYRYESSKSELQASGKYKNLDDINVTTNSPLAEPDHVVETGMSPFGFKDDPRKKIIVYEYWGWRDVDGDGLVKPIVATWVGDTFIGLEDNPFPDKQLPFVMVQYLPVHRSLYGEPDGALLEDNQQIMGAVTRGMIDIMGRSANGQVGMRRDMLDPINRRKFAQGENYEFNVNVDPRQGVHMSTFAEIPQSAQFMLQLQNQEAESLTGVKAFSGGLSGESYGEVAAGVRGVMDSASKRELGILRRLAGGFIQVGKKITAMNGVFMSEEEVVRITNEEFVTVRRDELQGEFDLKLTISTVEEDNAKVEKLSFMLQTMGPNDDPMITRKVQAKIYDLQKMPDLAEEIRNYQPEPDPFQEQMQQLELQKIQAEIALLQSQTQEKGAEAQLDQAKSITEGAKAQLLSNQADKGALDFVEQESGVKQERDLQKQQAQAMGNIELEKTKAVLKKEEANEDVGRTMSADLLRSYLSGGQNLGLGIKQPRQ